MAMAKRRRANRRFSWTMALLLVALAAVLVTYFWGSAIGGYSAAGTAYGAKNGCSCRYLAGRELGTCDDDFLPGMALVFLSEDEAARSVTATVPLIASDTATFRDGYGCVLDPA